MVKVSKGYNLRIQLEAGWLLGSPCSFQYGFHRRTVQKVVPHVGYSGVDAIQIFRVFSVVVNLPEPYRIPSLWNKKLWKLRKK